jgi:hypothetical protein
MLMFVCGIPSWTLAQRQAALANEFKQRIVSSEQTNALPVNGFGRSLDLTVTINHDVACVGAAAGIDAGGRKRGVRVR